MLFDSLEESGNFVGLRNVQKNVCRHIVCLGQLADIDIDCKCYLYYEAINVPCNPLGVAGGVAWPEGRWVGGANDIAALFNITHLPIQWNRRM